MAELVLRGRHNDQRVIDELLTDPASLLPRQARFIRRIVVDATAVIHTDQFARTALGTGTQLLVDPQTGLLTTVQGEENPWARLPFATNVNVTVQDLTSTAARARLIEEVVEFQLDHGGTAVIPPYLHLPDTMTVAAKVQRRLLTETAHYVRSELGLGYDIFPVVSVDRRSVSLESSLWGEGLGRLLRTAASVSDGRPFALGLSGTSLTGSSIHKMSRIWRRAAQVGPFIAWHAGDVGLLAVTMGAQGYEVGMCATERCDVRGEQRNRAPGNGGPGPRYTGVYIESLGRSISKSAATALSRIQGMQGDLGCLDAACCPAGFSSMLGTGRRQHAVRRRIADLEALDGIGARGWRLHHLQQRAADAAASAARIRRAADAHGIRVGAYPAEYQAMEAVVLGLRETARVAIA